MPVMPAAPRLILSAQTDARLVALARNGHEPAFEAIVRRHRRALEAHCQRLLPEGQAEDALQQALLAAWGALRRGDDVHDLAPWLHRIVRNSAISQLRAAGYDFAELDEALRLADAPD